jgi:alpha/beta superfamily hydrolase
MAKNPFHEVLRRALMPVLLMLVSMPSFAGDLVTLATRPGVTQSVFVDAPAGPPAWVVVLFAGDDGAVELTSNGPAGMKGNFLIKTALYWSTAGEASALVDAPSDHASGMDDAFRLGQDHADDVRKIVEALRQRYPNAKVALVGTSRGSISVGNLLERYPTLANAYVMTSPVTVARQAQTGLDGMHWNSPSAPVLVVSNTEDSCPVSPFAKAQAMASDNHFQFIQVSSSERSLAGTRTRCIGKSPHGFFGIEPDVLKKIDDWLHAQR